MWNVGKSFLYIYFVGLLQEVEDNAPEATDDVPQEQALPDSQEQEADNRRWSSQTVSPTFTAELQERLKQVTKINDEARPKERQKNKNFIPGTTNLCYSGKENIEKLRMKRHHEQMETARIAANKLLKGAKGKGKGKGKRTNPDKGKTLAL